MLPGRVHSYELGPLVAHEQDYNVHTSEALQFGFMPRVVTEKNPKQKKAIKGDLFNIQDFLCLIMEF